MNRSILVAVALALVPCGLLPACATATDLDSEEAEGSGAEAIEANAVIARAMEWVDARLQYCQSPNHTSDPLDPACSSVCERHDNSKWDPYRSDCSGLVSWAWGLPAPGRTTYGFAPFESDLTKEIDGVDLEPGDAVNNSDHVMLFKHWVVKGKSAKFIEEPGCSSSTPYAHEVESEVDIDKTTVYVHYNGMTFTAIRNRNVTKTPVKKGPSLGEEEGTVGIAALDDNGTTDINGDGKADACAFNGVEINCYLSRGNSFENAPIKGPELPKDEAANREFYSTIRFADINGDKKADVCVRESSGIVCWESDGHGFGKAIRTGLLTDKEGFNDQKNYSSIRFVDVNGDGKADLCARNNQSLKCWLSNGKGFGEEIDGPDWSEKNSFDQEAHWATLRMADINGDGKADVCARTSKGIECWLSDGHGFPRHVSGPKLDDKAWDDVDNWSTIRFADINKDGKADLCLRRNGGISCWHSLGTSFGREIVGPKLSSADGWDEFDKYSTLTLADIDGDGRADLCARRNKGLSCWISFGDHFGSRVDTEMLSDRAHGDEPSHYRTLRFGDVNGDGAQDVCFRNSAGYECHAANRNGGFGKALNGPAWSDKNGWDKQPLYGTIMVNGGR